MTTAEAKLWGQIRAHRIKNGHFRKQHPLGNYIMNFCAPRRNLVIEIDGKQHLDQVAYDEERTACLESQGFRRLHCWNHEVMGDIEGVLREIDRALMEASK